MAQAATASKKSFGEVMLGYFRDFKILKDNPREYWGVQAINFLDCASYFALLAIVTLFLSKDLGLSDINAGYVVTVFTSAVTIMLIFSGVVTDLLGIKKSLYLAFGAKTVLISAIGLLAYLPDFPGRGWAAAGLFLFLAPFMAMVQTIFQAANKRFTTGRSRSAGFNLWYLFMNVGAMSAGFLVDFFRIWLEKYLGVGVEMPNTLIVLSGVVTSILSFVATFLWIRREEQVYGPDETPVVEDKTKKKEKRSAATIFKQLVHESAFWRFVVLIGLLLGVRAVFAYMYLLMPKYWERIIGEDANIGLLNAINPFLIIVGLIAFTPIANRFNIFKMLVNGAAISALSLFALLIPWMWLSSDMVTAYYAMSFIAMVLLSIGEVIWSPKLSEYTAAIAPEGQEGTYLGLSMLPWFAAKTIVSFFSGHMLGQWVPETVNGQPLNEAIRAGAVPFWQSPEAMWLILGIWALSGPLLAYMFKGWLTKGARFNKGEEPTPAAAASAEPA